MYIKFNNFIIILFLLALSLFVSLSLISIKNASANNSAPQLKPSNIPADTYFYTGTIVNINSSSIKLYHGVTCIITGSTSCLAVQNGMMTMTSNAANMPKTSCSTLKKGQTVNITATKNAAGQLIAIKITPVFY
jgi:Cu/Ag efflux protein CusF